MTVTERLFTLQDTKYRDFSARLTPNISKDAIIGVRAPAIRALAKELYGTDEAARFMAELPHKYFDENNLHGALICRIRDYASAMAETERFLPYIDNWAVCDMLSPKVFAKHRGELYEKIKQWTASRETYTVRFGIGMLMEHFLDKDFTPKALELAADIRSEEYYQHDDGMVFRYSPRQSVRGGPSLYRGPPTGRLDPQQGHTKIHRKQKDNRRTKRLIFAH